MRKKKLFGINKTAKEALIESYNSRGYFKSFDVKSPVRFDVPYSLLTNPFMDWISSVDLSNLSYLEIGSGGSTIFFQKHFKEITSIEAITGYYDRLKGKLNKNVTYRNIDRLKLEEGNFNIDPYYDFCLIDDNLNRYSLTSNLLKKSKFAYLIFDSTEAFPKTCELIKDNGYTVQMDFWGFKNSQNFESCTSVFINDNIKLRLNKINRFSAPGAIRRYEKNEWDHEKVSVK